MNRSDKDNFELLINFLCNNLQSIISKEVIQEKRYKQKLYAVSSFLEFIKAGASVSVLPVENGKVMFVIDMK